MSRGLLFWILMILSLIFGILTSHGVWVVAWSPTANMVLLYVLLALLGWGVYGAPIKE